MSETKWTKGPWQLFNKTGIVAVLKGEEEIVHWAGFDSATNSKTVIPNAQLIASAPALYEALAQFVRFAESGKHPAWSQYLGTQAGAKMLDALRAARGEQ